MWKCVYKCVWNLLHVCVCVYIEHIWCMRVLTFSRVEKNRSMKKNVDGWCTGLSLIAECFPFCVYILRVYMFVKRTYLYIYTYTFSQIHSIVQIHAHIHRERVSYTFRLTMKPTSKERSRTLCEHLYGKRLRNLILPKNIRHSFWYWMPIYLARNERG